ncbi:MULTISPECIES: hypothetical protein [Robiginitalea]|nr:MULTISPECIES: hypothetical protein [Robiginitalea]MDC6354886.1 hypothetical protein [Robiginitalea sp. PM2]MDC6375152.1 hypothetical protein [Robiginitalea sp. SP8]
MMLLIMGLMMAHNAFAHEHHHGHDPSTSEKVPSGHHHHDGDHHHHGEQPAEKEASRDLLGFLLEAHSDGSHSHDYMPGTVEVVTRNKTQALNYFNLTEGFYFRPCLTNFDREPFFVDDDSGGQLAIYLSISLRAPPVLC